MIAVPLVAAVVFGLAGAAVTVLSTVAVRRPDRAAMILLVTVAGAAASATVTALLALMIAGLENDVTPAVVTAARGPVAYDPLRVAIGLGGAAVLLGIAGWLVRTGDWQRPDEE